MGLLQKFDLLLCRLEQNVFRIGETKIILPNEIIDVDDAGFDFACLCRAARAQKSRAHQSEKDFPKIFQSDAAIIIQTKALSSAATNQLGFDFREWAAQYCGGLQKERTFMRNSNFNRRQFLK